MTDPSPTARPMLSMTAPVAALSLMGMLTAAVHLQLATFALGSWTFPLAFILPGVIGGRQLMASQPVLRTLLYCLGALAANLMIEALGTSAQLTMLG